MRLLAPLLGIGCLLTATAACEQLAQGLGGGAPTADAGATATSSGAATGDAGVTGGGCGTELTSGAQLCTAISTCPSVVVDTQAMPSCGFRVRGGVADLVCACGEALCSMGVFTTCSEAQALLQTQTQAGICAQVSEGRCSGSSSPSPSATTTATTAATTPPPTSSSGNPGCDKQCMRDCGGGEACASVCNCT